MLSRSIRNREDPGGVSDGFEQALSLLTCARTGRGAQRYALLQVAIEECGAEVTDEDLEWFNEMKAAQQKGFSDMHAVGCRRPPLSTHTRASRVSDY